MSLATEYADYIRESRKLQLAHDAQAIRRLEQLLTETANALRADIARTPRGILGERYKRDLLASLDATLDSFRDDYKVHLDSSIIESARIVEERERKLLQAVLAQRDGAAQIPLFSLPTAERSRQIIPGVGVERVFGDVPRKVLEQTYARTYKDGLRLSQRLYNLDQSARRDAADIVTRGLATGQSARKMAKAMGELLEANGVDNVANKARRIARTEINTAYREGHYASVTDEAGNLKSYVSAIGWRLSAAHPRIDICDAWAGDDSGLGAGNYLPSDVPSGHPRCLCFTVSILTALPDEQFVAHVAHPDQVPDSQRRYYGAADSSQE